MKPRLLRALAVAFLCALHVWLAASVSPRVGVTVDEPIHVTSGRIYWESGDYRFQPENGNLPQRWLSLPLLGAGTAFPGPAAAPEHWNIANPWELGHQWFFTLGNDPAQMIARGRAMNALLGGVLCLVVYLWAASLYRPAGGFLALGLAVFCPNLLANAGLTTSDTCTTLFFVVTLLAFWHLCHRVTPGRVAAAGLAFGLLCLSKFSSLLLGPVAVLLIAARLLRRTPLPLHLGPMHRRLAGWSRLGALAAAGALAALLSLGVIWSAYGFRFESSRDFGAIAPESWDLILIEREPRFIGMALAGKPSPDDFVTIRPGPLQHAVKIARDARLLPEAWLYGLAFVARNAQARYAFLAGDYSLTGWREFFPVAFLLKTPPLLLLLLPASLCLLAAASRRRLAYRLVPAFAFLLVYWASAISSHLNIGYRHLLPTLPVTYVLAAIIVTLPLRAALLRWSLVALAAGAQALASFSVRPHYLTYFNPLAGGPANGYRYLVDSSLDWGQGLPALAEWLRTDRRDETVHLSYFGSDEPLRLGIPFTRMADELFDRTQRSLPAPMSPGLYCIGATLYQRAYSLVRGPWSDRYETAYRDRTRWFNQASLETDEATGEVLDAAAIRARLVELEHLRFGRLCLYLKDRPPLAVVGNSILVFRLESSDIVRALAIP